MKNAYLSAAASAGAGVIKSHSLMIQTHRKLDRGAPGTALYVDCVFGDWCSELKGHLAKVGIRGSF